jgi:uncharacterized protein HemX
VNRIDRPLFVYWSILVVCLVGLVEVVWVQVGQVRQLRSMAAAAAQDRKDLAKSNHVRNRISALTAEQVGVPREKVEAVLEDDPYGR